MGTARFELGTDGPTAILVGVDGSESSLRAAAYAAGLARRQGARLIAAYVREAPSVPIGQPGIVVSVRESQDEIEASLQAQLEEHAPRIGVDAELVVLDGNPYDQLLRIAAERKVDAIVVGASTQAGHRLVGSLAGKLVRRAKWPITVVP